MVLSLSGLGNKEIFAKNLTYYVERSGRSKKELAGIVGVAPSTFNEWTNGKKYPRIDKIEILSNYFGILKSDLIEDKSKNHREMQKKNNATADIVLRLNSDNEFFSAVEVISKLSPEQLASIKQMANLLLKG